MKYLGKHVVQSRGGGLIIGLGSQDDGIETWSTSVVMPPEVWEKMATLLLPVIPPMRASVRRLWFYPKENFAKDEAWQRVDKDPGPCDYRKAHTQNYWVWWR